MTIWYRASPNKNTQITFSGEGGLYVAGRWNYVGRKVIYCSESIALCTLEWLSHNGLSVSGFSYYKYSIDIPDDLISKFLPADLPRNWHATPAMDVNRDFAEQHLFLENKRLAIAVPSVIVPEEYNLIINPLHADFKKAAKTIENFGQFIAPNRDN